MKALTLTEPWASLVKNRVKSIETRSWFTLYRGPIAIHAAKTFPGWAKDTCYQTVFLRGLGWPVPSDSKVAVTQEWLDLIHKNLKAMPLGCVIATARLINCKRIVTPEHLHADAGASSAYVAANEMYPPDEPELSFGDYSHGRFAWVLENVEPLPKPIPAKGALGLWEWDPDA